MSKEIKVALLAIVALAALFIGFNFLRGSNVLSDDRTFYATYPSVEGLNVGAQVLLNGIKVGQVKKLELQPEKGNSVRASLEMDKSIVVGDSSLAGLAGSLLGSKNITLIQGKNTKVFTGGEELRATSAISTIDAFQAKALPVLDTVGATLAHINSFLNKDAENSIQGTLKGARGSAEALQKLIEANQANINAITRNMAELTAALNKSTRKLDKIADNFSQISDSIKAAPVGPALRRLNATMAAAQTTMTGVNKALTDQTGSLGKLINDPGLYTNLDATAASTNALMVDFKANPKRYVHFSVFGGGSKDKKTKTETETKVTQPSGSTVETEKKTTTK